MLAEFIKLPKEGETIGHYVLRERLSSSILGNFYLATHKLKHENVLLHILPEALLRADSRFQQKYKEVVEKQKQLPVGPAMAAVEMVRISGNLLIQYPAGNYKSMNDVVLNRSEPMPEERVEELLTSLGEGLDAAAKVGQGHYFMSPDFLFLNEDGQLRIAGIGLFQSIQYECFERFVSGAVMPISGDKKKSFSALEILSPEIRNFKARDLRSDFYCIGMCAYFILTGTKPTRRWATPTKARKEIEGGWDILISHCLEPKPADRFPNYRAFLQDLDNLDNLASGAKTGEKRKLVRTLQKIPLPPGFETVLNMRGLHVVRLLLLGLAGVMVIWTATLFFEIIYSDLETEVTNKPLRRVFEADQANLILTVSNKDARVTISGPESGTFRPGDAPLFLKGKRGSYSIRVYAPRSKIISRSVDLNSSETVTQHIEVTPNFASIGFKGVVGTDIYAIEDEDFLLHLGTIVEEDGLLIDDRILVGKYRFVGLHKSQIPAISATIEASAEGVEISLEQPPKPTELDVLSSPEGASVYVDGSLLGLTPLKIEGLSSRQLMRLKIEKEGYRAMERDLQFEQGENIRIDFGGLELKIGKLDLNIILPASNPPDIRELMLSIDGEIYDASLSKSHDLAEGIHLVSLEHPDYFPIEERKMILDRETLLLDLELKPRPVRMQLMVNTESAPRIFVDDVETPLTEQGYLPIPANREVKVGVVIQDYLSVTKWFKGGANARMEWPVPLKPIPAPELGDDYSLPYFSLKMVWLPAGEFSMGSPIDEFRRLPNEDTRTPVTLGSGFWVGVHEVTQELYLQVMGNKPSEFEGENKPVDSVSWISANEFCERVTAYESEAGRLPVGYVYRLPTEAEWEYASRAGTTTPFTFGDSANPQNGNFNGIYSPDKIVGRSSDDQYGTVPVGSYAANAFGLYDVHGNVSEWTADRYWDRHPGRSVEDPVNVTRGRGYTLKGGSWEDSADRVRSAAREGAPAGSIRNSIGFRVVLAPKFPKQ